jgi:cytochrome c2
LLRRFRCRFERKTQMTRINIRLNVSRALGLGVCLALCFAMGVAFHKYVGVSGTLAFVRSPAAYVRGHGRDWKSFELQQYKQDQGGVSFRRYVTTGLLPIVIDGKRLSDSYPMPKFGGAITVVDSTVVILDRLGGLYRYDLTTASLEQLRIPPLPNNLKAYLEHRSSRIDLTSPNAELEFRAHGITFLPDRKELAVDYDKFDSASGKLRTAVSVIPIDVRTFTATGSWQETFISDPYSPGSAPSSGGRMAYSGTGTLYLTLGDHYTTKPKVSQDPDTTFGKVIEIDLNSNNWRVFAMGQRNAQGLTFLKNGQLLSTDQGPRGGDRLDVIKEGSNYGWPNVTLGTTYQDYDDYYSDAGSSVVGRIVGFTAPLFAWVPDIAVSQLIEINNFNPRWNGDLLVGSLMASSLYRLRLEAGRVLYSEPIWIGQRIRDLAQTKDGTIVLWTDDTQLLFIKVDTDQLATKRLLPAVVSAAAVERCMACHHFGQTNPGDPAPSLSNLINRPIASDAFRYSQGLRAKQGNWTEARLVEFLSDPAKFAKGTNMPSIGLDGDEIQDIVAMLIRASVSPTASPASR